MASSERLRAALECLREDGLVAVPTETVWGLCACARSEAALAALRRFKGRADDKAISLFVASAESLPELGVSPDARAEALIEHFWPGPLTLVLPCEASFPPGVLGETNGLGLRCSPHSVLSPLVSAAEREGLGPLTATSLNASGDPPARDAKAAREVCAEREDRARCVVLEGEVDALGGAPSTVLDLTGAEPRVLRAGAVSEAAIVAVLARMPRSRDAARDR